jgi:hypothetical protein
VNDSRNGGKIGHFTPFSTHVESNPENFAVFLHAFVCVSFLGCGQTFVGHK